MEDMWQTVKNAYIETGSEVLGYANKSRKEWMSADTWRLVDERKKIRLQMMNNTSHIPVEVLKP